MKNMSLKLSLTRLSVLLLTLIAICASGAGLSVQQFNGKSYFITGAPVEIATWKYGALGVYTTIHDDWGSTSINGVYSYLDTINSNRGLQTSTAAIAGSTDDYYTNLGKEFIRHGHEIHSHSVTHTDKSTGNEEIVNSKAMLEKKLGVPVEFYVFPFDQWNDAAKGYLRNAGYLGARSGDRQPRIDAGNAGGFVPNMCNDMNFPDAFELQFDVFPRTNSAYKNVPDNGDATAFLKRYVADAISSKGWAIQEFHDLSNSNSLSIPVDQYRSLLDSVARARNKNEIWATGPTEVIRYRFARQYAGAPSLTPVNGGYTLTYAAPADAAKLNKYHTPLTVFFRAADMTANIAATQNGVIVPSRKISEGYFSLEADPINGPVSIVSAAKPYAAYPFMDPMDTIPSNLPVWFVATAYSLSGTKVYHQGAEYSAQYWTQGNNPSNGAPWNKVKDVPEKVLNSRSSVGGKISPAGKMIVAKGTTQTYTITADAGYDIDYVNVNGVNVGSVTSWTFSNVSAHNTIEVVCSPSVGPVGPTWTITSTAAAGGTITPAGASKVANNGTQNYAIAATAGNRIDSVVVDGVNKGAVASYSFTGVKEAHAIAAYFSALPTYWIQTSNFGPGSVTPSTRISVIEGGSQVIKVTPGTGGRLDSLIVNDVKVANATSYTFSNVKENNTIKGYFSAVPTFSITSSATTGGTITPLGVTEVTEGGSKDYSIAAVAGNTLDSVVVNGTNKGKVTTYSFTNVTAPQTISAFFSAVPVCSLTVTQTTGGTISPATSVVNKGSNLTISIVPTTGYEISDVVVNGKSVGAVSSYVITNISANTTVTATYAIKAIPTFAITSSTGANGTISPLGTTDVKSGASQTYSITPAIGYAIDKLTVNGKVVASASTYTFKNVSAKNTISVTFKVAPIGGNCADVKAWNVNDSWTTYKVGDKRTDASKLYECTAVAYSFYQPSSTNGKYGWKLVGPCN